MELTAVAENRSLAALADPSVELASSQAIVVACERRSAAWVAPWEAGWRKKAASKLYLSLVVRGEKLLRKSDIIKTRLLNFLFRKYKTSCKSMHNVLFIKAFHTLVWSNQK